MENYEILQELGNGLQGESFLVRNKESDEKFVMKKIECLDESHANCAFLEALTFKQTIVHPAIIDVAAMFVYWDRELSSMFLCIVYEFYLSGDLMSLMIRQHSKNKPIEEELIVKWFAELIELFEHIHSKDCFHCDLKPANILLKNDSSVIVTDFACPAVMSDLRLRTRSAPGSYNYMAPEFPQQPHDSRSDVWSLGCVLLQLVTCAQHSVRQMLEHLTEIKHSTAALDLLLMEARQYYASDLLNVLRKMLAINNSERPNITELMGEPYVASIMSNLVAGREEKFASPCKPFAHGESTIVYLKYIVDNIMNRKCIVNIFEHLWKLVQTGEQMVVLDTSKKQIIVQALRLHMKEEAIAEYGLQILSSLVASAFTEDYLFSLDFLTVICQLMKRHPNSATIQRNSIFFLLSASVCDGGQENLCSLRAPSLVLSTLRSFADDVQMSISCLNALWSFSSHDGNARILTEEKAIRDAVTSLFKYKTDIALFAAGCIFLVGLSIQEENKPAFSELGCNDILLEGLQLHGKSTKAVRYGIFALTAIVQANEECAYRLIQNIEEDKEINNLSQLVEIFEAHRQNSAIVSMFFALFLELARYEDIASEMRYMKFGEIISSTRKDYCDNAEIQSLCDKVKAKLDEVRKVR